MQPAEPVDIDAEVKKMSQAYGEDIAAQLRSHIEHNMPYYEYLKQFVV